MGPGGYREGYTGWVIPGSSTDPASCEAEACSSEAGPGSPQRGLEWVGTCIAPARAPEPPTPDPCRVLRGPLRCPGPLPASWPIRARISLIYCKVSQNRRVSPEYCQKACHSPCSQNGPRKSPLGILRFPFWRAFSPKELMGHFDAWTYIIVKMTKCRQDVHTWSRERVTQIPPRVTRASSLL